MNDITIEKIKDDELAEAKQLLSFVWSCTYRDLLSKQTIEKVTSVWHSLENLKQQAHDKATYFAVAKDKDKIIGIITAKIQEKVLYIHRLYIHLNYQRQGIGSQLFQKALEYFLDYKVMKVDVEEANKKAVEFYIHKGFQKIEEREDVVEGETLRTIVLEKNK
jgi:ribosomal protein S18 acetylase RimI-like enzyme